MLSDVLGVNDTDGDTIQAIRFENTGTDTLSYSLSRRASYLDSNVSYDLSSLKDVYVRGHTSFAEETIRVQLYDGYEWGEWTDVTMTSGTNVAPELRSVTDGSVIGGTLNTTIRTNERRALSEYISYYDDPNDDDNNLRGLLDGNQPRVKSNYLQLSNTWFRYLAFVGVVTNLR